MSFKDQRPEKQYVKSLDGIRGLAVLLVIFYHWPFPLFHFDFGWVGVQIFFVLSGYLITGSLTDLKKFPARSYFKNFYARRILRIFPLYFGLLILLLLVYFISNHSLNSSLKNIVCNNLLSQWHETKKFLFTFSYNIHDLISYFNGNPNMEDYTAHLWSISVEEQFYLVYPFIFFLLTPSQFKKFVVAGLFLFPIFRWGYVHYFFDPVTANSFAFGKTIYRNTFFQFDAFLTGAALHFIPSGRFKKFHFVFPLFLILLFISIVFLANEKPEVLQSDNIYLFSLINLTGLGLINGVQQNKIMKISFESPLVIHIGKFSYGIYMFHYLLMGCLISTEAKWSPFFKVRENEWMESAVFAIYFLLLYLISYCSYRFYENKFLILKNQFN